jgi:uncharacterized protein YciI
MIVLRYSVGDDGQTQQRHKHKYTLLLKLFGGTIMHENTPTLKSEKKHFVVKLIPPRPTFAVDMTEEESNIMKLHAAYWKDKADRGIALVYGPVLDPKGVYGLGIIEVDDKDQARTFAANDPAVKSGLNQIEIYPMRAILGK